MSKKKNIKPGVVKKIVLYCPNMLNAYRDNVVPNMVSRFNYANSMQVPKLLSISLNMGLGDAKLLSAIGFWFGWISLPFIIFISSLVALLVVAPSLVNKSKKMSSEIPFGPYIIIGCILFISFSNQIKYFII